jgi:hypothetical protein
MIPEFEQTKAEAARAEAEVLYCEAQICLQGDDKLRSAHDLLFHDDKLTYEEHKELWNLLQYVMSSPKDDLAPEKSELIGIKIQNAAEAYQGCRDRFLGKVRRRNVKVTIRKRSAATLRLPRKL